MSPRCRVSRQTTTEANNQGRGESVTQRQPEPDQHRVRVWFGTHVIEDLVAPPDPAASYEAAMRRRFAGLLVTNEPMAPTQERL